MKTEFSRCCLFITFFCYARTILSLHGHYRGYLCHTLRAHLVGNQQNTPDEILSNSVGYSRDGVVVTGGVNNKNRRLPPTKFDPTVDEGALSRDTCFEPKIAGKRRRTKRDMGLNFRLCERG